MDDSRTSEIWIWIMLKISELKQRFYGAVLTPAGHSLHCTFTNTDRVEVFLGTFDQCVCVRAQGHGWFYFQHVCLLISVSGWQGKTHSKRTHQTQQTHVAGNKQKISPPVTHTHTHTPSAQQAFELRMFLAIGQSEVAWSETHGQIKIVWDVSVSCQRSVRLSDTWLRPPSHHMTITAAASGQLRKHSTTQTWVSSFVQIRMFSTQQQFVITTAVPKTAWTHT